MIELLEGALDALGSLADDLTFVGGATIGLWITNPAAPFPRATDDVDAVCDVTTYVEFSALEDRLRRETRLRNDPEMVGRWRDSTASLVIDVMPAIAVPLGFSNPWYPAVIAGRTKCLLPSGRAIYAAPPPLLIATKVAAWRGRGAGDLLASRDAEDILTLIDGRVELADEVNLAADDVREEICLWLAELLEHPHAEYAIEAAVTGYGAAADQRAELLRERIDLIARDPH